MSATGPDAASTGRRRRRVGRPAVFLGIVLTFVLLGPLVFTAAAMLALAAFVLAIEPGNLGDLATISVGAVLIAYVVGLLPAAATGLTVAARHIAFGGAGPIMATTTGAGFTGALLLAAAAARGGYRLFIRYPALPIWLILSAAAASLACWWIAIGRGSRAKQPAGEGAR